MKRHTIIVLNLLATTVVLAGCNPTPKSRYYLRTEQIPEGTVTSVFDRKLNTQLLYIAELNSEPPSINVLPVSNLDVKSVAIDSMGEEDVLIVYDEKDGMNRHTVHINEKPPPRSSTHVNSDNDKDGQVDMREVLFRTDSGLVQYFDLDANGILDAQSSMSYEDETAREVRVLIDQCWVVIAGEDVDFHDPTVMVTSKEEPLTTYQFHEGTWRKTETPATPQ